MVVDDDGVDLVDLDAVGVDDSDSLSDNRKVPETSEWNE